MSGEINFSLLDTQAPLRAAGAFQEAQNQKRQNKLAELAMQQQEQAFADDAAQREVYKTTQGDPNALLREYANRGMYKQAEALKQQMIEREAKQTGIKKDQSLISKNDTERAKQKLDYLTKSTAALAQNPSYENAQALLQQGVMAGVLSYEEAQQHLQSMPRDPAQIKQIAMQANGQLMTANERMTFNAPKPQQMNLGNRIVTIDMNPNSPTFKQEIASAAVGMNPGQAASLGQSERHFQANQALEREKMANGGKAPAGYRFNPDGSLQAIPGGPADKKLSSETDKKTSDANDVIGLVQEARAVLPKAHGSGIGSAMGAASNMLGIGNDKNSADAQLKVLSGALVSKMPKMSGPQSDKDVMLYREMAGQVGDSTLPIETRLAALDMVERINAKHATVQPVKSGGIPVSNW